MAASSKCRIFKPEAPSAASLGKENKLAKILNSEPIDGISMELQEEGCLDSHNCQIASILGASPEDRSRGSFLKQTGHGHGNF